MPARPRRAVPAVLAATAVLGLAACGSDRPDAGVAPPGGPAMPGASGTAPQPLNGTGAALPDRGVTDLATGATVKLSSLAGPGASKPLLVWFWAPW
ncbi:MAG: hypothetical protein U0R70_13415 [Solirubrobacteraceae bacterium]